MSPFPKIQLSEIERHRWSVASLVAANVLPLVGVVALGWRAFDVVFLYWFENVVIGAINVLKMLTCWPDPDQLQDNIASRLPLGDEKSTNVSQEDIAKFMGKHGGWGQGAMQASKLFFVPFFTFHYGLFCAVHGVFVCVLLGGFAAGGDLDSPLSIARDATANAGFLLAALGLAASHLVSYFTNFLGRGEYRRTAPPLLMMQPYPRVVVLHVAIVLSGFLMIALGSPIALLVLLVIGKTWLDLALHLREHEQAEGDHEEEEVIRPQNRPGSKPPLS